MIRIVIVDDHQILIDGIKSLLANQNELEIIGHANNGQEFIDNCISLQPDLVMVDISMPVVDGITMSRELKKTHPANYPKQRRD